MKIAIIGAGLSGLSLAWHLLSSDTCTVTVFDMHGIGGGASGIAAGLMHPYPGQMGTRSFLASEGMQAAKRLVQAAQEKSPVPLCNDMGIIRYAHNEQIRIAFLSHAKHYGDIEPYGEGIAKLQFGSKCALFAQDPLSAQKSSNVASKASVAIPSGENGFLIRSGMTIFCRPYLEGLWRSCEEKGAKLLVQKIDDLGALSSYDAVVLAAGAGNLAYPQTKALRLEPLKGQILKCRIPEGVAFPDRSLIGKGYIAKAQEEGFYYIGSTYERRYLTEGPELEKAQIELIPKARLIHSQADAFSIVDCQAGIRVMRIGHYYPMAGRLQENLWIATALGSRGLLYHGLVAEQLSRAILEDDPSTIPREFHLSSY